MKSVEDLDVFKLAHQLALKTYTVTSKFPKGETFSLANQMRRAATSVGMNLMEGSMRLGSKEYRQFVGIARGSAGEVCLKGERMKYKGWLSSDGQRRPESQDQAVRTFDNPLVFPFAKASRNPDSRPSVVAIRNFGRRTVSRGNPSKIGCRFY
jgi:four helix bundle protein